MLHVASPELLADNIQAMTLRLLRAASELTYNHLSTNCLYIFSEITPLPITEKERFLQLEKTQPVPQQLADIMPNLLQHYANFYDINLFIHRANQRFTVIDIRYYPKSSLDATYQQLVVTQAPMLHGKVAQPYWTVESNQKFDINWKVYAPISRVKRLWLTQKWRLLACFNHFIS